MRQGLHAVHVRRPGPSASSSRAAVQDCRAAVGDGGRGDDAARRRHVVQNVVSCVMFSVVAASAARTADTDGEAIQLESMFTGFLAKL